MKLSHVAVATALVLFIAGIGVAVRFVTSPDAPEPRTFPEALTERLILPLEELGEDRREVKYAADGITILSADIYFTDGSVGYAKYQSNGNVGEFGVYYPLPEGVVNAQVKMQGQYDSDGLSLLWEKRYTEAGVMWREGKRLEDGNYLVHEFLDDGIGYAGVYVFNGKGERFSVAEFYDNGNTKKLVKTENYTTETTEFFESGKRSTFHSVRGLSEIWETYQPDGETLIHRFEQVAQGSQGGTSYHTLAQYYNADGTLNHERKFSRFNMYVTIRDDAGEVLYQQLWENKKKSQDDVSMAPDQWVIDAIFLGGTILDEHGSIWFEDGRVERYVYDVEVAPGVTKTVIKVYHPDGNMIEFNGPDPENPVGPRIKVEYEPGENPEQFDLSILGDKHIAIDYLEPPKVPPAYNSRHR